MTLLRFSVSSIPDIDRLQQMGDIPAIIRLLGDKDPTIQKHAAEALGTLGSRATPLLLDALHSANRAVRLGAVEAFGTIKDILSVDPLIRVMHRNPSVRWKAVLASMNCGGTSNHLPLMLAGWERPEYFY